MLNKVVLYLVDDHDLFLDGMCRILSEHETIGETRTFSNGKSFLESLNFSQPDLVFCDLSLPDINGIEIARTVKSKFPEMKFVLLSMHDTADFVMPAMKSGINGFVHKSATREELFAAIDKVLGGGQYLSRKIEEVILSMSAVPEQKEILITNREKTVLEHMAKGLSNKEIAEEMDLSVYTIETHKKNMMNKTVTKNALQLLQWARQNKWLMD